jgi:hypothetical protein
MNDMNSQIKLELDGPNDDGNKIFYTAGLSKDRFMNKSTFIAVCETMWKKMMVEHEERKQCESH